ncbi:hypothetical protein [Azospirillum sp.]|uniref:hypothetical protein n=1 Tax=Azospirillum sp. TaxID=34012 RepID=UPI003D73F0CA
MQYVYRFWNATTGGHFYTRDTAERNSILANLPSFRYEGVAYGVPEATSTTVWRFYRMDTGTHFYTASVEERDQINRTLGHLYRYEGAAFDASSTAYSGAPQAVYRFYNTRNGTHFFTASDAEREAVARTLPEFRYEGIAYYAPSPPTRPFTPGPFAEAWYLSAYPDVAAAVQAGLTTALGHYMAFGEAEGRLRHAPTSLAGNDVVTSAYSAPGYGDAVNGGEGNDTLSGGDGDDRLYGETGNDTLYGQQADNLNGGSGDDTYYISSPNAVAAEAADGGTDTLWLSVTSYALPRNVEYVRLNFDNSWVTTTTRISLSGNEQANWVGTIGSADAPMSYLDAVPQLVEIHGGAGNDTLNGGRGDTLLYGDAGDDLLTAGAWQARSGIAGVASGNDTLAGGAGNDTIEASNGSDVLTGDAGNDTFLFDLATNRVRNGTLAYPYLVGSSLITDFTPGEDVIRIRGTNLTAQQVYDRFQSSPSPTRTWSTALRATFTYADFTAPNTEANFDIVLDGLSRSSLSAGSFVVSSS